MIEKAIKKIDSIIRFIESTKEYYSDGVDEELIDMLEDLKKPLKRFLQGK